VIAFGAQTFLFMHGASMCAVCWPAGTQGARIAVLNILFQLLYLDPAHFEWGWGVSLA
jgi:hypothetical protein